MGSKFQGLKIGVIGAGPAGLTAAYQLAKAGVQVTVFEAGDRPGGMARSFELWGQLVDVGPHRFFSNDTRVNKLWLEVLGDDYEMVSRLTRIYYRNKFFDYPLKASNALQNLGLLEAIRCVLSYIRAKSKPIEDESTFEAWVTNRFGARLFGIFFRAYTEKLWGIKCSVLDADFAAQRIKKLDLYEAIKASIFGGGGSKHKTLVDEFAYPRKGAGAVYELMAQKFTDLGGELKLNCAVADISYNKPDEGPVLITTKSGDSETFDHVISTMPITKLVQLMNAPSDVLEHSNKLKFRNTIIVYLLVEGQNPFPDQWIYVHSPNLATGRITNFSNWVPSINNNSLDTILCLEYWCYDEDPVWGTADDQLIKTATEEMRSTSLLGDGKVLNGHVVRVPKCYPVYSSGYREHLQPVEEYLQTIDCVTPIGRYGSFKYNNQDHSILMGILAAENISQGANNDLWGINTDYEYQESSTITATGLNKVSEF